MSQQKGSSSIAQSTIGRVQAAHYAQYFSNLDGLRALAITAVLIHHYSILLVRPTTAAFLRYCADWCKLGVDLFFAISGFLITGILYDSKEKPAFLYRFFKNRSLRIFPAYFALLAFAVVAIPQVFRGIGHWPFVLYWRNWKGPDSYSDGVLGHLWSLAIEEQFYVAWALIVSVFPKRLLAPLALALSVFALAFRIWMFRAGFDSYDIARFTLSRMDGLLLGAFVAVLWRTRRVKAIKVAGWIASVAAIVFIGLLPDESTSLRNVLAFSVSSVLFAAVVMVCSGPTAKVLGLPALRHIAKYSYAIYLWHLVPLYLLTTYWHIFGTVAYSFVFILLSVLFSYAMARLSWVIVESPMLRLKSAS